MLVTLMEHVVSSKSPHDSSETLKYYTNSFSLITGQVAATIKTAALPQNILCDNKTQHEKNMNWNKVTQQQKLKYQQASKIWLSKIPLFEELTSCVNPMYKNQQHIDMLEQFYTNIVEALKRAASEVLTNSPKQNHNVMNLYFTANKSTMYVYKLLS